MRAMGAVVPIGSARSPRTVLAGHVPGDGAGAAGGPSPARAARG